MHKRILATYAMFIFLTFSTWLVHAKAPPGKLVMLDVSKLSNVTSKTAPDDEHLSWRELVNSGINGVHFRSWCFSGDGSYSQLEWVREAHRYGLWVCGGTGNSKDQMVSDGAYLASLGVDFIQLDEPMGKGFTENDYRDIKNSARKVNAACPVMITDVFYNDTISKWSSCDGIMQEVYVDQWYPSMIDAAVDYKNSHPAQDVFMWVWLMTKHPDNCTAYPDDKFNTWFTDSFNRVGKVLLFIFNTRSYGDPVNCVEGTNWPARIQTIKNSTSNLRVALPRWRNFSPATEIDTGLPDCSVEVRSAGAGLDPASVRCEYSIDSGRTWHEWSRVSCTGGYGTKAWQTITAESVPFSQVSLKSNRIRFWITDCYKGNYYRSARTDKAEFNVKVRSVHWSGFSPSKTVTATSPDCSIQVRDSDTGLLPSTAEYEYSTNGGKDWRVLPAECTGLDGTTEEQTITARAVPFNVEHPWLNKIRFRIKTYGQDVLQSKDYTVKVLVPPEFKEFSPRHTTELNPDCKVKVQDSSGLIIGAQELAAGPETLLLLHLNGNLDDSAQFGHSGILHGSLNWPEMPSWQSGKDVEKTACFDGVDDYIDFDAITLESQALTMSVWVQAQNSNEAAVFGGVEENGSVWLRFRKDRVIVQGRAPGANKSLESESGSFAYDHNWRYVVVTVQGEHVKLYINGQEQGEAVWSGFEVGSNKYFSLGRALNRNRFFKGCLDEVFLEGRALSSDEIAARYHSGLYRYSTDKGSTWSSAWTACKVSGSSGSTMNETMSVEKVPFKQYSDTDNVVAFMIMDKYGNLAKQVFTVGIAEFLDEAGEYENGPEPDADLSDASNFDEQDSTGDMDLDAESIERQDREADAEYTADQSKHDQEVSDQKNNQGSQSQGCGCSMHKTDFTLSISVLLVSLFLVLKKLRIHEL
ncbi:MAG: LamG domain-containing protein [Deltaproteobacteria bacterium]|nr:LamG domain-containing protein [Deltaproteobacteria bacterium]